MTVAGRIDAVWGGEIPTCDMSVGADARWLPRRIEPRGERLRLKIERRLHQACVYAATLAVALAAQQRGKNSHRQQRRTMMVDHRDAHRTRSAVALPGDRHDTEQRLRQQVLTGSLRIWTIGAVA